MKSGEEIRDEENPFLREVWAAGWDDAYVDQCTQELVLVDKQRQSAKRIEVPWRISGHNWHIKTWLLIDGREHSFLSEQNGNAQRFRDLIKP
jgi:hypothetical protein